MVSAPGSDGRPLGTYAQWQASRSSVPTCELADLVRRAVGSEPVRTERILQGYSNEVYRIRTADAHDVVVRILRFDDDVSTAAAAAEAATIDSARAAGVPAPEILLLDTVEVDGEQFPVMVQRTVAGDPLDAVIDRLSHRHRHDLLVEIGTVIARMNAIVVAGDRDWVTAMTAARAGRVGQRDKIITAGFSARDVDEMFELLDAYIRDFPCGHWILSHGDLSLKHIFVTVDADAALPRVSGIIDFGDWLPGAPVHDLAVFRVREPQLELEPLLRGYGRSADPLFRRRLDLHTVLIALGSLAFGVDEGDRRGVARTTDQLRTVIADLTGGS
ncbi:phosphotransferase family protein [Microlunatus soli]|nr:aminoglycoside phosphotransferase family protein [Microlunatus soli]